MRLLFTSVAIVFFIAPAIAQQTYRWTDEKGQVHYSAEKPTGKNAQVLNLQSGSRKKVEPKKTAQQKATEKQEQFNQEFKQQAAKDDEQTKTACTNMRKDLALYKNYPKAKMEVEGVTRRLTEEELNTRIAEAEKNIKENCQDY